MKYFYIWFKEEFLDILNKNGYVHFYTKEKCNKNTLIDGRAFYYCIENKTYGYVDVIPNSEIINIENNIKYLNSLENKDK